MSDVGGGPRTKDLNIAATDAFSEQTRRVPNRVIARRVLITHPRLYLDASMLRRLVPLDICRGGAKSTSPILDLYILRALNFSVLNVLGA